MRSSGDVSSAAVLVTGATGGIGYFVSEQLAQQGRRVLLAARDPAKAEAALAAIRREVPGADLHVIPLDLADLGSVARACELVAAEPLAALIANAALVSYGLRPEPPRTTVDGVEIHLGTAYLGHYALVARLLPHLEEWGTRVVHAGSLSSRIPLGREPWSRARSPRREPSFVSYTRSKQAVTVFGMALAAHLASRGSRASSVIAHPGTAVDVLSPEREGVPASQPMTLSPLSARLVRVMHGKDGGAAVLVHAATDSQVRNGDFWGPAGTWQLSGPPVRLKAPRPRSTQASAELLRMSAALTGVTLA